MSEPAWRFCPRCGVPLVSAELAGRLRGVCHGEGCGFVAWGNPLPVVAALIQCDDRDGKILLARNGKWAEGKFALVTGFLEGGEAPEGAIVREVAEETALVAQSTALIGVYPFFPANEVVIAYHVRAVGEIVLNEELAEYRLIEPAKLKAWEFGTGLAVRDWLAGRGYPVGAGAVHPSPPTL